MITKAIIKSRVLNSNKYEIEIPFMAQAGFANNNYYEAILSHEPALTESYSAGDVVLVGFEDHNGNKPIILGKLFTEDSKNETRGVANLDSLMINSSAQLPENTKVGDVDLSLFLSSFRRLINNQADRAESEDIEIVDLTRINS